MNTAQTADAHVSNEFDLDLDLDIRTTAWEQAQQETPEFVLPPSVHTCGYPCTSNCTDICTVTCGGSHCTSICN